MRAHASQPRASGVPCPGCAQRLTLSLEELLAGACQCFACGFEFHLERSRSRPVLEKLQAAQRNALALLQAL